MVGEDRPANCKSIRNERKARSLNSGSGGGEQRLLTKHGSSGEKGRGKGVIESNGRG